MKKILQRVVKRGDEQQATAPSRITNETVAEHREKILAGGRKFKYPVQYSKHRLIINSVIISVAALLALILLGWWQLYPAQNTSQFMYRLTQFIPVPVAKVDGAYVPYSSYLKKFRSSLHFLEEQNNLSVATADGKRQVEVLKRRELDGAIYDAYVAKLARENHIKITDKEVNDFINRELVAKNVSIEGYERTVLNNFYNWSLGDYKEVVKNELVKRKLSLKIDKTAYDKANRALTAVRSGKDFAEVAAAESDDLATKQNGGDMGEVSVKSMDPNGIIAALSSLEVDQMTGIINGADGYYIAKLTGKTDKTVKYSMIKVSFSEVANRFEAVKKANKIKEYIKVKDL